MVAITLPVTTAPGQHPHESGGRLINCRAEKLSDSAGTRFCIRGVEGLKGFATSSLTGYRGMSQVGSNLYIAHGSSSGKVSKVTSSGGAMTALTGNLPGTADAFFAFNNAGTPDLVAVVPGEGAFSITTTAVSSFADSDVGSPNSVCFHKGFFVFTYGTGIVRSSDINAVTVNTNNFATAEYRPDTLYRGLSYRAQLLLAGSESIEFWGGQNDTGFPFSPITAIDVGIVGPNAMAGDEVGFGAGIFFVSSDYRVRQIEGYGSVPVSTPDLDRLIAAVTDKTTIKVSVYIMSGNPIVVVGCDEWTWEYNVTTKSWNERVSYLGVRWRGLRPHKAFDKWLCGDTETGNVLEIDYLTYDEIGDPLRRVVETGPQGDFPKQIRVNGIEIYCTKGVGNAEGSDPDETNPTLGVQMTPDGGFTWKPTRLLKVGRQSIGFQRVRDFNFGIAEPQGVRWRFVFSDGVPFTIMGGDMDVKALRP